LVRQSRPEPDPKDRAGSSNGDRGLGPEDDPARLRERAEAAEHALHESERAVVEADRRRAEAEARLTSLGEQITEEQIFGSKEMFQLVLNTIPQRVFWKDVDSVYVGCNAPFARDAGCDDPSELVGRTDYDILGNRRRTPTGQTIARS
jgi:hypothetical protein